MCPDSAAYRLVVKVDGQQKSQGTGWFVTKSKVITAGHVVKKWHELPHIRFELEIGSESLNLTYLAGSYDPESDVAVLHVADADRQRIRTFMVLALADARPNQYDKWSTTGFPARREGKEQTADGHVSNPRMKDGRLQLCVYQGTDKTLPDKTWEGISGAPLMIGNKVAGVVTIESGYQDNTAYAVPYTVVEKIVPELQDRARRVKYRDWFLKTADPRSWSNAYAPKVALTELTLNSVEQLGDMLVGNREDRRVWLIVGDETEGRKALLNRVADRFAQNDSIENEDGFDLPIWLPPPPYQNESVDRVGLTEEQLRTNPDGISPHEIDSVVQELRGAAEKGRALFIVDDVNACEIEKLRQGNAGNCRLLAGVTQDVAEQVNNAKICRIVSLSDEQRRSLAAHWLNGEQVQKWVNTDREFLPLALRPLDVSIWCRAQIVYDEWLTKGDVITAKPQPKEKQTVDLLDDLVEILITGSLVQDHPKSSGFETSSEKSLARRILAACAYVTLMDGVAEFDPPYIAEKISEYDLGLFEHAIVESYLETCSKQAMVETYLEKCAKLCGVLVMVKDNTYRFTHTAFQEYFAASAMDSSLLDLTIEKMAGHADQVKSNVQIITKWSRALALRLDDSRVSGNDASKILGDLLNYKQTEGFGPQLRNNAGPLHNCVCQAVLQTDSLEGEKLRKAVGWESPNDWTGYRPDAWRTIEEILRYLDGVASRVRDDKSLAHLFLRFLKDAKIIDIALIRYSLAKVLKTREKGKEESKELNALYKRETFFELAGHPCADCAKTRIENNLRVVHKGWFLMGAKDSEERSWPNELPQHRVQLEEYSMTCTEVTNEQYDVFDLHHEHEPFRFPERHPADLRNDWETYPVVRVSWYEAWCFAEWMGMKLPTEAQWEKAARGYNSLSRPKEQELSGPAKPYWFDGGEDELVFVARFKDNSDGHLWKVDLQRCNTNKYKHPLELAGLCGNVWEWCMDEQGGKYTEEDQINPAPWEHTEKEVITNRMIRGGSFNSPAWNCRHAVRHYTFPTVRADTIGFRLVQ